MKIGVPKESAAGERRVSLIPESVKRLAQKKLEVVVEPGAGDGAGASDDDYRQAGATLAPSAWTGVELVLKVQPPSAAEVKKLAEGAAIASLLYPRTNVELVKALAGRKATVMALDAIPRTTLAQLMDVLSSQATVAGYRAAILAAEALPRLFPMLMTAAGTIAPAKVLVLGAGVAGLQAIATARRLGAVVEATDVRKVVKEQVQSLGAKFLEVDTAEDAQTASGYAKEVSDEYKQKQAALTGDALARCDACITTALIPGRPAPRLIDRAQVARMRRGSVIVDLAAEQGGNCELTQPGKRTVVDGVMIIGETNLPSQLAPHASQMFSRNMEKLLGHITKDGALALDFGDEIVRGLVVARGGEILGG
ncbi:MAG TPA: Re/Si-specific NAD(P)(+) transhydrogenase subunit alpha [Haliangiales bacterium]|nr:Re/Si-specific NAD(P)(+) transhydrogenase subunit alpha [Haliangiales bacterium]